MLRSRGREVNPSGSAAASGFVVNATLERAIHTESAESLVYHFGIYSGLV
jgi:hypothetical protein